MNSSPEQRARPTTGRQQRVTGVGLHPPRDSVLVADDDRDLCGTLVVALNRLGFRGRAVVTGDRVLATVIAEEPVVVLVDLCLPGLSGWDVARRIRATELARQPRLVAITGLTDSVFRLRSMAAGFDDHLVKPISIDELKRVLALRTQRLQ